MELADGRYRILERLGSGGTGTVYGAADRTLGRRVALKILHESLTLDLLRHEGRSLARLNHPNVVAVHDLIEDGNRAVLVMEWVDGCDLQEWLDSHRPLTLDAALDIFDRVAAAVAYAHAQDIVHCDLKPANILISQTGEVKLTDLTLARARIEGAFSGVAGGSSPYAAPEQLHGGPVDERSDVYGLGVLLRHLTAGAAGNDERVEVVSKIVSRATATDADDRFSGVAALLADLPASPAGTTRVIGSRAGAEPTRIAVSRRAETPGGSRRAGVLKLAAIPLLAVLLAVALISRFTASAAPAQILVPDVVAAPSQSAALVAHSVSLRVHITHAYSSTAPAGVVVAQQPAAGSRIRAHGWMTLTVSDGPRPVAVPDLSDLTQAAAVSRLRSLGFHVLIATEDTITHDAGHVLDQSVVAGTLRIPGSVVTLTISARPWWWPF